MLTLVNLIQEAFIMERIICPCKGCDARCAGCHGSCKKYLEWKEFDAKERKWLKDSNGIYRKNFTD